MSRIPLGGAQAAGRVALVDSKDRRLVVGYSWSIFEPEYKGRRRVAYARTEILRDGRRVGLYMHQLIGGWPMTDHINHDGLDNRRSNLRPVTPAQNAQNRRPHAYGSSRYKGVMWSRRAGKWEARISNGGRKRYLGVFADEEDAALAYNAAALETYGAYAYLNPVDGEPGEPAP
jgi:AP2 domain